MPEQRPNVLLLMCDQMQWAAIAGRSPCRMPNVQRLVDQGMLFDRAYTPSAICCPARAMLISGAYHWHNGVMNQVHVPQALRTDMFADVVTYAQRLQAAGYFTGYTGKWHASHERSPLQCGFSELSAPMGCTPAMLEGATLPPGFAAGDNPRWTNTRVIHEHIVHWPGTKPFAEWQTLEGDESRIQPAWVADAGIGMLHRAVASGRPWHVEIQWQAPHCPYVPFKRFVDGYDPASIPIPPSFYDTYAGKSDMHLYEEALWKPLTEADYRDGRVHYYAYCEQLDTHIGRVLDALEQLGQSDNTLVFFTTDHGDMVGAHRFYGKDWMPYEECYRIPLVARWPGRIRPGSRTPHLVQLHDIGHTLMDMLGLPPLPFADGRSLRPLFDDPQCPAWDDAILCGYYGGHYITTQRILITARYKYVHNGYSMDEMYDLQDDPHEMRNLLHEPALRPLRDRLREHLLHLMTRADDPYSKGQKYGIRRYLFAEPSLPHAP